MVRRRTCSILAALGAVLLGALEGRGAPPSAPRAVPLFVIVRAPDGLAIRTDSIGPGETRAYRRGSGSEVVEVLLPVGTGRAGNLVPLGTDAIVTVRRTGDSLRIESRSGDRVTSLPPRRLVDLAQEEMRVSVVTESQRAAFVVRGWARAEADTVGPVEDLFAGKLPPALLAGAAVVTTDTRRLAAGPAARGRAALTIGAYARVEGVVGGRAAELIVDLGAAQTTLARDMLPPGTHVDPAVMVEYSAAGRRDLESASQGATGPVRTLGTAELDSLRAGDIVFRDVTVSVVEALPASLGPKVGGVLGIDLLQRGRLTLELGGDGPHQLTLSDPGAPALPGGSRVPFSFVHGLICVRASVGGTPLRLLLDSGAPLTFVDDLAAPSLGIAATAAGSEVRGIGGQGVAAPTGRIEQLDLGPWSAKAVPCRIADLSVLRTLRGGHQAVGLLGLETLARLRRLEVDFATHSLTLVP